MRWFAAVLTLSACSARTSPDAGPQAAAVDPTEALLAAALAAHQRQDYPAFVAKTQHALATDPDNAVHRYNLACGHALLGQPDQAFAALQATLDAGHFFDLEHDPDLASLHGDPRFDAMVTSLRDQVLRIHNGERAFDLGPALDLAPEGIAHDPATGRTFVGSTRYGRIDVHQDGTVTPFATIEVGGRPVSVLGLEVDAARDRLWAVGTAFGAHVDNTPEDAGITAVIGVDLASGAIHEVHRGDRPGHFGFNDVAVGPDGALYLSGSGVFVVRPGTRAPVRLQEQPLSERPSNGIAVSSAGVLYVADREGISRIDLTMMTRVELTPPEGVHLGRIDGLYAIEGGLVGVQHQNPWRVVRIDLKPNGRTITGVEVIEQRPDALVSATTGAVVGDDLLVIGRAALPEGTDADGLGQFPGQATVLRVPLHP